MTCSMWKQNWSHEAKFGQYENRHDHREQRIGHFKIRFALGENRIGHGKLRFMII